MSVLGGCAGALRSAKPPPILEPPHPVRCRVPRWCQPSRRPFLHGDASAEAWRTAGGPRQSDRLLEAALTLTLALPQARGKGPRLLLALAWGFAGRRCLGSATLGEPPPPPARIRGGGVELHSACDPVSVSPPTIVTAAKKTKPVSVCKRKLKCTCKCKCRSNCKRKCMPPVAPRVRLTFLIE